MKIEMKVTKFENEDVMTASLELIGFGDGNASNNMIIYHAVDNDEGVYAVQGGVIADQFAYDAIKGMFLAGSGTVDRMNTVATNGVPGYEDILGPDAPGNSIYNGRYRLVENTYYKNTQ